MNVEKNDESDAKFYERLKEIIKEGGSNPQQRNFSAVKKCKCRL